VNLAIKVNSFNFRNMNCISKLACLLCLLVCSSLAIAQGKQAYTVEEVLDSTSVKLFGTLLVPPKSSTVILFIAGSGPTDRNGNSGQISTNCTKLLAEELALNGIASLRYDKRGVGQSKVLDLREEDIVFETMMEDAARWMRWLRRDNRFKKIIVAGHSEGSLVGMVVAQQEKAEAYISLAGTGRRIDIVIHDQVAKNPYNPPEVLRQVDSAFHKLKKGELVENVPPYLMALLRPSVQPFMISWLKYDPAVEISKLNVPVLIIQGSTDIQVSVTDSDLLKDAAPKAMYKVIEGMNHIFKDAPNDQQQNIATYRNPELPLSVKLVPAIIDFIKTFKL
jgi:uncharacterized protein